MGDVVARGVRVDVDAWSKVCRRAHERGVGVCRFAGDLVERAIAAELALPPPPHPPPSWVDTWKRVPMSARASVRRSLRDDVANFRGQYAPGDDQVIDTHVEGLTALLALLDEAEASHG